VRIFVYEKAASESVCKSILRNAICIQLPNVGREANAYLTHVVDRYDKLGEKVVFVQGGAPGYGFLEGQEGGHLMPGSDFFYDYLSPTTPPRVVFTMAYANLPDTELLLLRNGYPFNAPQGKHLPTDSPSACADVWDTISNDTKRFWDALHPPQPNIDLPNQLEYYKAYLQDELGPMEDAFLPFANGAVLSASAEALRKHPKAFFEQLRRTATVSDSPDAIFYLELLFPHITGHGAEASACSKAIAAKVAGGGVRAALATS